MPATENSFCALCDPFDHGWCKCSCCQCEAARSKELRAEADETPADRKLAEADVIDARKCACILAVGRQCTVTPMEGKEWCYDCSAGYCDFECSKCRTNRHEPEPETLYSPPVKPRSDSDDEAREMEVQGRIKEAVEATRSEAQCEPSPVSTRLHNTTASLSKYAEDRAMADKDRNAA